MAGHHSTKCALLSGFPHLSKNLETVKIIGEKSSRRVKTLAIGCIDILDLMFSNAIDINMIDNYGRTMIASASMHGQAECVKYLAQKGADLLLATTGNKMTPLHEAAKRGHYDVCDVLLQSGANANLCDVNDNFPIHLAAYYNHSNICKILSDRTLPSKCQKNTGKSPLISCLEAGMAEQGMPDFDTEEAFETLQVLLQNGWDPNQCLSDEKSKLYKVLIFQSFESGTSDSGHDS